MPPERIVSLVPSLTELVVWLGAGNRLVGRTKFCTEPPELAASVPAVGGTKNPDRSKIRELAPDLVIANREENRREDVEALKRSGVHVVVTDPNTVRDAITMIRELGALLHLQQRADELAEAIESELVNELPPRPLPVYVGVWHNPLMGLGSESYGHSLLEACGGRNVLSHRSRYPELTMDDLRALRPELILLPDEPFPFDEGHAALYLQFAPARVIDGKLLWWYGPRIPGAIRDLRAMIAEVAATR